MTNTEHRLRNPKLSNKLIAILFISTILIQTILGLLRYTYYRDSEISKITQTVTIDADELANSLTTPLWNLSNEEIHQALLLKMKTGNFLAIFLYNQNDNPLSQVALNEQNQIIFDVDSNEIIDQLNNSFQKIDKKIFKSDEQIGRLEMFVTVAPLQKELNTLISQIISEMIIISIISILVIFLSINGLILKRISELTNFVINYSPKNKQQTITINSTDEIGKLGDAFNKMIESLKFYNKELKATNESLEQKIRIRTEDLSAKNQELEAFNAIVVNRELKMISLKEEIASMREEVKTLKKQLPNN